MRNGQKEMYTRARRMGGGGGGKYWWNGMQPNLSKIKINWMNVEWYKSAFNGLNVRIFTRRSSHSFRLLALNVVILYSHRYWECDHPASFSSCVAVVFFLFSSLFLWFVFMFRMFRLLEMVKCILCVWMRALCECFCLYTVWMVVVVVDW